MCKGENYEGIRVCEVIREGEEKSVLSDEGKGRERGICKSKKRMSGVEREVGEGSVQNSEGRRLRT